MKIGWGKGLVLFFVLFFVWIFSFILFALRQKIDLVSDDYYQRGARYSDQIQIDRRSAAYQDSLQITADGNRIEIALGKTVVPAGDSVQIEFFRPSDKTKDLHFRFKMGTVPLAVDKKQLIHGRYQVFVSWGSPAERRMVKKTVDIE